MSTSARSIKLRRGRLPPVIARADASSAEPSVVNMAASITESRAAERHAMIADAAYFRAQQRGFVPGHEIEDWLAAEEEIIEKLHHDVALTASN